MTLSDARKNRELKPSIFHQKQANCPFCRGTGKDPRIPTEVCPSCEGRELKTECPRCVGNGKLWSNKDHAYTKPCPDCQSRGTGVLSILEVKELDDIAKVVDYILFQTEHYNEAVLSDSDRLVLIKLANALKWIG